MAETSCMRRSVGIVLACALTMVGSGAAPAAEPQQGPRQYSEFTYERTFVEMRDGVELAVDIWRPVTPKGVKVPVILSLTPYHSLYKAFDPNESDLPAGDARLLVLKGYAYARADVRGTWNSGGCWNYGGIKERRDGYDMVEWFGTRPWSNGKVAMTGGSYDGTTANAAAIERPPHLATIIPVSAISRWWGYAYQQGTRALYSGESIDIDPPSDTPGDFMTAYGFLPPVDPAAVTRADQIAMRWNVCDRDVYADKGHDPEPDYDDFWDERDYLRLAHRVEVPVLVAHGMLDFNVKTWESTAWFDAIDAPKILVAGQWPHASPRSHWAGWDPLLERWLERWLYGVRNGVEFEPAVQIQSSDREWYAFDQWGGSKTVRASLGKGEFTFFDDPALTESEMLRGVGEGERYVRIDLPKVSGVHIQGRPVLRLHASSDATSTHFNAVLCEVDGSGRLRVISRAFMNARYHDGLREGNDLEPGKRYRFDMEFIDKDYVVPEDSHLAVLISSSSATWIVPDQQRATNTLHLKRSTLELPVLGR